MLPGSEMMIRSGVPGICRSWSSKIRYIGRMNLLNIILIMAILPLGFGPETGPVSELQAEASPPNLKVRSVSRIWDAAPHSAFTDLMMVGDRLYCAFREGAGHVSGNDGRIRVIARDGDGPWESIALLDEPGVDLRDPKISRMPDGRLMLNFGGSYYEGSTLLKMESRVSFSNSKGRDFSAPRPVIIDEQVRCEVDWLWRVTWHDGVGYGVVYQPREEGSPIQLVRTSDGVKYELITTMTAAGVCNETTLRFRRNGDMVALIRREGDDHTARFGVASPPYKTWTFHPLPEPLGGPDLIEFGRDSWLLAGRRYLPEGARTGLAWIGPDLSYRPLLTLPSGGDTSYPGLVLDGDTLLVSYYSSHEEKTCIYLADIEVGSGTDVIERGNAR